jgi:RNA polymerase sigma-70 factor (ECF subfamily)
MGSKTADERHAERGERASHVPKQLRAGGALTSQRIQTQGRVVGPDAVYERVAAVVERTVWFHAGSDPERDDIAQDALLTILRNRGSVAAPEQLEAWAARVTFNTICNAFRRRKLRRWLPLEALQGTDPAARESDFEAREVLIRVHRLLERLPAAERIPLTLDLLENASRGEIARRCGCSKRTVRRRLKSAHERFLVLARADPGLRSRARAT